MTKNHLLTFIDLLKRICDDLERDGLPMSYVYLNEFRMLKQCVCYYYSVTKDAV